MKNLILDCLLSDHINTETDLRDGRTDGRTHLKSSQQIKYLTNKFKFELENV